jgi:hypothetical protein
MENIVGIIIILHGLVHLLYFGQSKGAFEMRDGMTWPIPSWAFSRLLSEKAIRNIAGSLCLIVATGFVISGIGLLIHLSWWNKPLLITTILSTILFLLCWDGKINKPGEKGGIAILINIGILCLTYLVIFS